MVSQLQGEGRKAPEQNKTPAEAHPAGVLR
jgi:hypothetical protein